MAFIAAGISFVSLVVGPSASLFTGAIYLVAGLGIKRGRAWSAYGLALFFTVQLFIFGIRLREVQISNDLATTAVSVAILILPQIVLFLFAGRSLSSAGVQRGRPYPWLVLSALVFVPFLFLHPYVIPTGAMEDTLLIGDRILALVNPRSAPTVGEILVFRYPVDRR